MRGRLVRHETGVLEDAMGFFLGSETRPSPLKNPDPVHILPTREEGLAMNRYELQQRWVFWGHFFVFVTFAFALAMEAVVRVANLLASRRPSDVVGYAALDAAVLRESRMQKADSHPGFLIFGQHHLSFWVYFLFKSDGVDQFGALCSPDASEL